LCLARGDVGVRWLRSERARNSRGEMIDLLPSGECGGDCDDVADGVICVRFLTAGNGGGGDGGGGGGVGGGNSYDCERVSLGIAIATDGLLGARGRCALRCADGTAAGDFESVFDARSVLPILGIDVSDLEPMELPQRDAGNERRFDTRSLGGVPDGDELDDNMALLNSALALAWSNCSRLRCLASALRLAASISSCICVLQVATSGAERKHVAPLVFDTNDKTDRLSTAQ
jgi:hypothetical protein